MSGLVLVNDLQSIECFFLFCLFIEKIIISFIFFRAKYKGSHHKIFSVYAGFDFNLVGLLVIDNIPLQ